jgi:hypothetical protein
MTSRWFTKAWLIIGAMLLVTGGAWAADAAPNAMIGNWTLNAAKSKFEPGPALKSYTIAITDAGSGKVHTVATWVESSGAKGSIEYTVATDGTPAPVTGYANADSVTLKATSTHSSKMSLRKAGKEMEWGRYKVSADGKSLHATEGGTDETGAKYKSEMVFDRQ